MAIVTMTRKEAEKRLSEAGIPRDVNGEYFIIDVLKALGLLRIQEERQVIDIRKSGPVEIQRHGNTIYIE